MFLWSGRYRFSTGKEAEGFEILKRHAALVEATAEGCEAVWLGQGQHPSTDFVLIEVFRDEAAMNVFEGRLRSDPSLGSDMFSLLRLTTQPPEMTQYKVLWQK